MRLAHWSIWAPNRSGMYHTTRDIVRTQQERGMDCGFIDAFDPTPKTDGTFSAVGHQYADTADIYAMHLTVPEPYMSDGTPVIVFLHGHPLYSMQVELYGLEGENDRPWTTIFNMFNRSTPTWFVSFWKDDQADYWAALEGIRNESRVWYAPRGIRFGKTFSPDGPTRHLEGDPAIVIADQFRMFKDALPALWGAYRYWERNPKARVHLYALPPKTSREREAIERWILSSNLHRCIGGMYEIVDYLPEVYRAADVLVSTVTCESRVMLEAHACGCPTVAPWDSAHTRVANWWRPDCIADAIETCWVHFDHGAKDQRRRSLAADVRTQYDINRTVDSLAECYARVMEG